MKKISAVLSLLMSVGVIFAPMSPKTFAAETTQEAHQDTQSLVEFPENTNLKEMKKEAKDKLYQSLDKINHNPESTLITKELPKIEAINSDDEFTKVLEASKDQPQIIYLGFQACPYCKAFSPKISKVAEDFGATIHYYDVQERKNDPNFNRNVAMFKVNTVPHAFIIEDGKIVGEPLDSESTMAEIETFVVKVVEAQ